MIDVKNVKDVQLHLDIARNHFSSIDQYTAPHKGKKLEGREERKGRGKGRVTYLGWTSHFTRSLQTEDQQI
jgi:hypothetical protein